jgi:hypothetical protein
VFGVVGLVSAVAAIPFGNLALFYGGGLAAFMGLSLAAVLTFAVYRDRERTLRGTGRPDL